MECVWVDLRSILLCKKSYFWKKNTRHVDGLYLVILINFLIPQNFCQNFKDFVLLFYISGIPVVIAPLSWQALEMSIDDCYKHLLLFNYLKKMCLVFLICGLLSLHFAGILKTSAFFDDVG